MAKCDLENCQLDEKVEKIAAQAALIPSIQETVRESASDSRETRDSQAKMSQRLSDYIERGKEEHDILFERTRGIVTWKGLALAFSAVFTLISVLGTMAYFLINVAHMVK